MNLENVLNFSRYIAEIILSGSYVNDWLTQLPVSVQSSLFDVGHALATWLGY